MSISALTSTSTATAAAGLVQMASGEYTADSVAKDQKDATRLALVREKDGNYGTTPPAPTESSAAAQSSSTVISSLSSLTLGGN